MVNAFQLSGLRKSYGDFQLGPLQLTLGAGSVLGYIGPNGAGKTTTMLCLAGLVVPDGGSINILGESNDQSSPSWKETIGYVGDVHSFYENWTAEQNLLFMSRFFPRWSTKRMEELAYRMELPLNKRAKELSSGNRVKLSLVAALARSPRLLLLDEPTQGLDPVARKELLDILFEYMESEQQSLFYATHRPADISHLADELAFVNKGQIQLQQSTDDLLKRWRKISFRSTQQFDQITACVNVQSQGDSYQVVSSDCASTVGHIKTLGAEGIQPNRMGIDEIVYWLLKDNPTAQRPVTSAHK